MPSGPDGAQLMPPDRPESDGGKPLLGASVCDVCVRVGVTVRHCETGSQNALRSESTCSHCQQSVCVCVLHIKTLGERLFFHPLRVNGQDLQIN